MESAQPWVVVVGSRQHSAAGCGSRLHNYWLWMLLESLPHIAGLQPVREEPGDWPQPRVESLRGGRGGRLAARNPPRHFPHYLPIFFYSNSCPTLLAPFSPSLSITPAHSLYIILRQCGATSSAVCSCRWNCVCIFPYCDHLLYFLPPLNSN